MEINYTLKNANLFSFPNDEKKKFTPYEVAFRIDTLDKASWFHNHMAIKLAKGGNFIARIYQAWATKELKEPNEGTFTASDSVDLHGIKTKDLVEALRHYANRMGDGGLARQVLEKYDY